jgi:hypothetical protein
MDTISTIGFKPNARYAAKRPAPPPNQFRSLQVQVGIMTERDALLTRIRAEYQEMPGMTLRLEQVARLCGVERSTCKQVLDALVDTRFLCLKPNGVYARVSELSIRPRPARASLDLRSQRHAGYV